MQPTRRRLLAALPGTVALAGCLDRDDGSNADGAGTGSPAGTATPEPTGGETGTEERTATESGGDEPAVSVESTAEYGDVLVGADGLTLYMFDQDTKGEGGSACHGGCADSWPPLTVDGTAEAGDAVAAELTTFERAGGETQVAAAGWPLYYFAGDDEPGETNGQGVNDVWWVLDPEGTPIRGAETPAGTSGEDSDGGSVGGY